MKILMDNGKKYEFDIGGLVYFLVGKNIYHAKLENVDISEHSIILRVVYVDENGIINYQHFFTEDIGKIVFFNKEEINKEYNIKNKDNECLSCIHHSICWAVIGDSEYLFCEKCLSNISKIFRGGYSKLYKNDSCKFYMNTNKKEKINDK